MRRLLLVTYYFPPAGGAGTLRALRFARYLRTFDWHVEVICATPLPDAVRDASLQESLPPDLPVQLVSSFEPGRFADSWEQPGQKIVRNLFRTFDFLLVPDEHVGWVKPAIRAAQALQREHGAFDAILTTGPPFSTHLIGLALRERWKRPWVADFRDDWIGFNDTFRGGAQRRRPQYEKRLEANVLRAADVVLTINDELAASIRQRASASKVQVIPNGFDPGDFVASPAPPRGEGPFVLCHAGSLYEQRSPARFLDGLRRLAARQDLRGRLLVRFLGRVVGPVPEMLKAPDLEGIVRYDGVVPHSESIETMQQSHALLLIIDQVQQAEQIWTGKVFEYLGARRPILGLMPTDGSLARVLHEDWAGHQVVRPDDVDGVGAALEHLLAHPDLPPAISPVLDRFRADHLTQRLAHLLDEMVKSHGTLGAPGVYRPKLDPAVKN